MSQPTPENLAAALKRAVAKAGNNQSRFAAAVGTSQQLVSYWLKNGRPLPGEYVLKAEQAGLGSRHELRPDLYPNEHAPSPVANIAA
ncbi:transcriptional regulator [Sphingomonas sp. Leaf38]|uniref:transcriptional regulator n=1 Tax=Sphingomonas sp. Leaf38 TaxID=1736217 RepID=UPI0009E73F29|nr:YdaS family helix-turn-helix protein [Sphingomonas sp. Leaf38]